MNKNKAIALIVTATIFVIVAIVLIGGVVVNKKDLSPKTPATVAIAEVDPKPVPNEQKITTEDKPPIETSPASEIPSHATESAIATPEPSPIDVWALASTHLNITEEYNRQAFQDILTAYPDRFTNNNAERNIKALRAFSAPGSTGINTINNLLGANGEYFDSALAEKYANL